MSNVDDLLIECRLRSNGATIFLPRRKAAGLVAAGLVELVIDSPAKRSLWSNTRSVAPNMVRG